MPFCYECGKPVAAKAKFCRNCGASQEEVLPIEAAPAPVQNAPLITEPAPVPEPAGLSCKSCGGPLAPDEKFCGNCGVKADEDAIPPAPAPAAAAPAAACPSCGTPCDSKTKFCGICGTAIGPAPAAPAPIAPPAAPGSVRLCTACGNPIQPGEKYCSKCLVMVRDNAPPAPAPAAAMAYPPPPPPASIPAAQGGVRLCTACGNPIQPGEKYCSKCLVMVKDNAPPAPAAAPVPVPAPGGYSCATCGNPLSGNEKFCGTCGGPAVAVRTAVPAASGKVCPSCGAPVSDTTKFCGGCGAPVGAPFPTGPVAVSAGGEEILGIIPNAKKMKMMGMAWDSYTLIVTGRRMVIAQLTTAMLNAAVAEAQARAKAEGKGFFGIMGDQLSASFGFAKRYEAMSPDAALAETPGNFAIENSRITLIKVSEIRSNDDDGGSNQLRLNIDSADGRFEYVIGEDDRFTTMLQNVYGDRVKMPFGLFKAGPVRIKFF